MLIVLHQHACLQVGVKFDGVTFSHKSFRLSNYEAIIMYVQALRPEFVIMKGSGARRIIQVVNTR